MMKWVPQGVQAKKYAGREPRPVNPDILLVKLRSQQVSESMND
jgi:DNA-directed RNA polymerase I and III subunit RPAC1